MNIVGLFLDRLTKRRVKRRVGRVRPKGPALTPHSTVFYCGEPHILRVTQASNASPGCAAQDKAIHITLLELSATALGAEIQTELHLWYKKQARRVFQERLPEWAARFGVTHGRLIVTNPSRRWGSCNAKNDIRLNWRLILLPPELLDYVVAHELAHVLHKDHSRAFWHTLATVMPDCRVRRARLREWERRLAETGWH